MEVNTNELNALVKHELLTFPEHLSSRPVFSGVDVARYFVFFVDQFLSFSLVFFVWQLCCLSFFKLRILIAHLVSNNSS